MGIIRYDDGAELWIKLRGKGNWIQERIIWSVIKKIAELVEDTSGRMDSLKLLNVMEEWIIYNNVTHIA